MILGRHVFAHIDDLKGLVAGLAALSHERTLVGFEVPYLVDFLENTEFDTVYHEHLSYVPVRAVEAMLRGSPFQLERVNHYPIHGGSILFQFRNRAAGTVDAYAAAVGRWLVTRDGFDFLLLYLSDYDYASHAAGPTTTSSHWPRRLAGSTGRPSSSASDSDAGNSRAGSISVA